MNKIVRLSASAGFGLVAFVGGPSGSSLGDVYPTAYEVNERVDACADVLENIKDSPVIPVECEQYMPSFPYHLMPTMNNQPAIPVYEFPSPDIFRETHRVSTESYDRDRRIRLGLNVAGAAIAAAAMFGIIGLAGMLNRKRS